MKSLFFFLLLSLCVHATIQIIDSPIIFDDERVSLSKEYIHEHYGMKVDDIQIQARMIVVHWTATNDFKCSMQRFTRPLLPSDRPLIKQASPLNVSTHFVVDRNGTIYRLMDEKMMARHVIGLNYCSIGIENVGGENNIDNLTPAQFKANIKLIKYLKDKHPEIEYLIGHHEYTDFTDHPLWLEKDEDYRTLKYDPGDDFMSRLRSNFPSLKAPEKKKK
jgi:beta-N-acetylhexosaminidase